MNDELNNGYNPQNIQNNQKNEKIPEQGNFSASPNNEITTSNVPPTQNRLNSQGGLPPKEGLGQPDKGLNNPNNNAKNSANNGFNPNSNQVNRGNQIRNNQNLNRQNKINQAKQEVLKKGAKAAANAVAGPAAGAAVDALSKTKAGQKALDTASNALSPNKFSPFSFFGKKKKKNEDEEEATGEATVDIAKKVIGFGAVGTFGLSGCLTIIAVLMIIVIIISPLFYINELINSAGEALSDFGEKLGNFLTFRGWCNDEECQEVEQNNFYEHINEVYDEYLEDKNVRLNATLLTATLTYAEPFTTLDDEEITSIEDLAATNYIDFRKSDAKIDTLAEKMVSYCCYENGNLYMTDNNEPMCRGSDGTNYDGINYNCPQEKGYSERYILDIDRYEEYLRDDFVRKFYFDNKSGNSVDAKVDDAVDEIFLRVAMYEDYANTVGSSANFTGNNTTVTILDCNNNTVIEQVSLYEYLQGVLYVEGFATGRSEEFLKVMAVVAKNFLYALNGVSVDSVPTELRVRSCQMNQIFCSVTEGCHSWEDGTPENCSVYNSNSTACDTIASGPDENGNYRNPPLDADSETLEKIKNAIDSTLSEFIIKDGKFVLTQYRASCSGICDSSNNIMDQAKANDMIESGGTYKEVLNYFYNGDIEEVELYIAGYPLDLQYNNVTSAYGWRVDPIRGCCRHHNGTDIGADPDANIYSIADGVVVTNTYHNSYGNYTIIGHGQLDPDTGYYEYYSLYAHQIRLSTLISVGDTVRAGQQIGDVGSTGDSTGPHLHIEIYSYVNGRQVRQDPVEYFSGVELTGQVGGTLYDSESQCQTQSGSGSCS